MGNFQPTLRTWLAPIRLPPVQSNSSGPSLLRPPVDAERNDNPSLECSRPQVNSRRTVIPLTRIVHGSAYVSAVVCRPNFGAVVAAGWGRVRPSLGRSWGADGRRAVWRAGFAWAPRDASAIVVAGAGRRRVSGRRGQCFELVEGGGEVVGPAPGGLQAQGGGAGVEGEAAGDVQQPVASDRHRGLRRARHPRRQDRLPSSPRRRGRAPTAAPGRADVPPSSPTGRREHLLHSARPADPRRGPRTAARRHDG